MAAVANRRSVMTLFSNPRCMESHRVRIVLAEKSINYDVVEVTDGEIPEDLLDLNPYNSLPTLVDRELVLYEPRVVQEYLDERFPHPPLMPVDPVSRARIRLALHRVESDWCDLIRELDKGPSDRAADKLRKQLKESLVASSELFAVKPFFLSDEFTLVDCAIAPMLWRLPEFGISLPAASTKAIAAYEERIFARETFRTSLSEAECEMRGG